MEKLLMNYNDELKDIYTEYSSFLATNEINSRKSIDFIFDIIDYFDVSREDFKGVEFDPNLKCKGIFIPEQKRIVLNTSMLEGAYKLRFISYEQMITDYFSLLFHEVNHLLQYRYRKLVDDDISLILNISEFLKNVSASRKNEFHDLFPDEIDSNIRSSKLLYEMNKTDLTKKNLLYYLALCTFYKNTIINSQIDYLYGQLFGSPFDENIENINSIFYGLKKNEELFQAILDSYQTHELCVDIDGGRRLKLCN